MNYWFMDDPTQPRPSEILAAMLEFRDAVGMGFARVDARIDGLESRFDELESRIDKRFDRVDRHLSRLDDSVTAIEARLSGVERRRK